MPLFLAGLLLILFALHVPIRFLLGRLPIWDLRTMIQFLALLLPGVALFYTGHRSLRKISAAYPPIASSRVATERDWERFLGSLSLRKISTVAFLTACPVAALFALIERPDALSRSANIPAIIFPDDALRHGPVTFGKEELFGVATPSSVLQRLLTDDEHGILFADVPDAVSSPYLADQRALTGITVVQEIPTTGFLKIDVRENTGFFAKTQLLHVDNAMSHAFRITIDDRDAGEVDRRHHATYLINPGEHRLKATPPPGFGNARTVMLATPRHYGKHFVEHYVWNLAGANSYTLHAVKYSRD